MILIIFEGKPIFSDFEHHDLIALIFDLNLVIRLLMIATEGIGTGSPVADHLLELHRQCRNSTYAPPAGPFLISLNACQRTKGKHHTKNKCAQHSPMEDTISKWGVPI